jgi:hypothetical protein
MSLLPHQTSRLARKGGEIGAKLRMLFFVEETIPIVFFGDHAVTDPISNYRKFKRHERRLRIGKVELVPVIQNVSKNRLLNDSRKEVIENDPLVVPDDNFSCSLERGISSSGMFIPFSGSQGLFEVPGSNSRVIHLGRSFDLPPADDGEFASLFLQQIRNITSTHGAGAE